MKRPRRPQKPACSSAKCGSKARAAAASRRFERSITRAFALPRFVTPRRFRIMDVGRRSGAEFSSLPIANRRFSIGEIRFRFGNRQSKIDNGNDLKDEGLRLYFGSQI